MGQKRFPPLHARKVRRIKKEKTTRNLEGIGTVIVFIKCILYFIFVNFKDTCTLISLQWQLNAQDERTKWPGRHAFSTFPLFKK